MKLLIENWRNFINEEEEFSPEEKILQIYNSGGRDNRLLAREMAKTFDIDFAEMQKDYKQKISTMLKSYDREKVIEAIRIYKSVGMGDLLANADLTDVNFEGIDLSGSNLRNADLSYANLSGADLSGTDLSRAFLDTAIGITPKDIEENPELYKGTKWPDGFKITEV
jgi:hypothetical protein